MLAVGRWLHVSYMVYKASKLAKDPSQRSQVGLPCSIQAVTSHHTRPSLWTSHPRMRERQDGEPSGADSCFPCQHCLSPAAQSRRGSEPSSVGLVPLRASQAHDRDLMKQCREAVHAGPDSTDVPLSPFLPSQIMRGAGVGISANAKPQGTCTGLGQKPGLAVWQISSSCGIPKSLPGFSQPCP